MLHAMTSVNPAGFHRRVSQHRGSRRRSGSQAGCDRMHCAALKCSCRSSCFPACPRTGLADQADAKITADYSWRCGVFASTG
jgi:hypothetical protein